MWTGVPQKKPPWKGGQKSSTVKDPGRASLPSNLPKTISVSFINQSPFHQYTVRRGCVRFEHGNSKYSWNTNDYSCTIRYESVTSAANGGHYGRQYKCDIRVDNLKPTQSIGRTPKLIPSSIDNRGGECKRRGRGLSKDLHGIFRRHHSRRVSPPLLSVWTKASQKLAS